MKREWLKKGFVDEKIPENISLIDEISRLKKEKNALLMAHYYQVDEIQDIADFVGDSLALAWEASKTDADIILLSGVLFMGETAKILSPHKKVLIPDTNAGCSLADSCPPDAFEAFINKHPDHTVVTYVNTNVGVKALSDIVVTSTNAVKIINSIPKDQKILFGPDKNLGNYLQSISGREMVIWDGACHVHERFSVEKILELKNENPDAEIIAHPEFFDLEMGDALSPMSLVESQGEKVWKRKFSNGVVYINPFHARVTGFDTPAAFNPSH